MRRALVALALAVAACANGGSEEAQSLSQSRGTPLTTVGQTPEAAFLEDIESSLTITGPDSGGPQAILDLAQLTCDNLEAMPEAIYEDDAAADSPTSDAALAETTRAVSLAIMVDESGWPPEAGAVILRAMARHLCPGQADAVEDFLRSRGL